MPPTPPFFWGHAAPDSSLCTGVCDPRPSPSQRPGSGPWRRDAVSHSPAPPRSLFSQFKVATAPDCGREAPYHVTDIDGSPIFHISPCRFVPGQGYRGPCPIAPASHLSDSRPRAHYQSGSHLFRALVGLGTDGRWGSGPGLVRSQALSWATIQIASGLGRQGQAPETSPTSSICTVVSKCRERPCFPEAAAARSKVLRRPYPQWHLSAIFVFVIDHDACLLRSAANMQDRHQPKL